ncbi:MAG: porin family protein [Bacteroidota bacterium]
MRTSSLLIILIFLANCVFAQSKLKLGLRLSPIFSSAKVVDATGNEVSDQLSTKLGGSFGLMADWRATENYGIHTGVHIVNKGFKRDGNVAVDSASTVAGTQNVTVTAIEIPLALKLRTTEFGDGWYADGLFGLSVDITASNSNRWTGVNPVNYELSTSGGTLQTQANLINPVNFSFIFGVGAEYEVGNVGRTNFGLVYHRGLTNLNRQSAFQPNVQGAEETFRLSYFSLELGYYFN